ncbi:MAG: signal peptidase I [Breznakia sp.]
MKKIQIRNEYILLILRVLMIFIILSFVVTRFVFRTVRIEGESMEPTLKNEAYALSNRLAARLGSINRFDLVVIANVEMDLVVKRIIALPDETVSYQDGKLYINGEWYEEPFLNAEYIASHTMNNAFSFTRDFGAITLGEDEYFVLGDNRLISKDSRSFGAVSKKDIIAKDILVVSP